VQIQDGRRIVHPSTGRSFQIPLLGEVDAIPSRMQAAQQRVLQCGGPGVELAEARKEEELQYFKTFIF